MELGFQYNIEFQIKTHKKRLIILFLYCYFYKLINKHDSLHHITNLLRYSVFICTSLVLSLWLIAWLSHLSRLPFSRYQFCRKVHSFHLEDLSLTSRINTCNYEVPCFLFLAPHFLLEAIQSSQNYFKTFRFFCFLIMKFANL